MTGVTLLCVGSGLARRYKHNTLQILALPRGAYIQFRYDSDIIPESLQKRLKTRELWGATVLLGYVDCTESGRRPDGSCCIVPCRYGRLLQSGQIGSVFILQFELQDFAATQDLAALQETLPADRPHWETVGEDKVLKGFWCQELPTKFAGCRRSDDIGDWQSIIRELANHDDFSKEPYYFRVLGIFERGQNEPVALENGECVLRSNKGYAVAVFHWDPKADSHTGKKATQWLKLDTYEPWLEARTNPILTIDAPYDVSSVEIRTGNISREEHGLVVLRDTDNDEASERLAIELPLPVKVKGTFVGTILIGIGLGLLLTSQQLIAIFSNKDVEAAVPLTIAAIILGMATGLWLAFGLPRPQ
jgi:hypothetical protein